MLSDNLKKYRNEKGLTQETLAVKLNVVRQTVSTWEKGLSVPDAEMLQKIAEVLEVDVSVLLGAELPEKEEQRNEIAEQLAQLNEQLALRNRRTKRILRGILIGIPVCCLIVLFLLVLLKATDHRTARKVVGSVELSCSLGDETYGYGFEYNENFQVLSEGGDAWIINHIDLPYDDANQLYAHLKDYFEEHGGSVTVIAKDGVPLLEE